MDGRTDGWMDGRTKAFTISPIARRSAKIRCHIVSHAFVKIVKMALDQCMIFHKVLPEWQHSNIVYARCI